jgi:hypothetical protein
MIPARITWGCEAAWPSLGPDLSVTTLTSRSLPNYSGVAKSSGTTWSSFLASDRVTYPLKTAFADGRRYGPIGFGDDRASPLYSPPHGPEDPNPAEEL